MFNAHNITGDKDKKFINRNQLQCTKLELNEYVECSADQMNCLAFFLSLLIIPAQRDLLDALLCIHNFHNFIPFDSCRVFLSPLSADIMHASHLFRGYQSMYRLFLKP